MVQVPIEFLSHNLDDSLDPAQWVPSEYQALSEVSHLGGIYKAIETTSDEPGEGASSWAFIESNNFNRMLEDVIVTRTRATASDGTINMTIRGAGNYLSLIGLSADYVSINGVTQDLAVPVSDMWQYYAAEIETKPSILLPVVFREQVTVEIGRANGAAELGKLFLGREVYMGELQHTPRQRMTDYSLLERDGFGYVRNAQQRGYSSDIEGELHYPVEDAARQYNALAKLRSRPALYINHTLGLMSYGALRQIDWAAPKHPNAVFNFYIEGYV